MTSTSAVASFLDGTTTVIFRRKSSAVYTPRLASNADDDFLADLATLGLRPRRGHDLRRTFVTLAQVDGARRDVLKVITHGVSEEFFAKAGSFSLPDSDELYRIVDTIPDTRQLLADLKAVSPEGKGSAALEDRIAQGTLEDMKLSSTAASGVVVVGKKKHPIHFLQVDGQWRIDVEPLSASTMRGFRRP